MRDCASNGMSCGFRFEGIGNIEQCRQVVLQSQVTRIILSAQSITKPSPHVAFFRSARTDLIKSVATKDM